MRGLSDGRAGLVAILSTERSGSTLLSQILGGSSRILAPPELHGFRYEDFAAWQRSYPLSMTSLSWTLGALGRPTSVAALADRFAGRTVAAVYEELLELAGPERLLVDKTPAYARSTAMLARLEAFAPRCIHLVRHPLGVALSRRQGRAKRDAALLPASRLHPRRLWARLQQPRLDRKRLVRDLAYWRHCNETLVTFLATLPAARRITVAYEDLVERPRVIVPRLAAFLGVAVEEAMYSPGARLPEALGKGVGDWKIREAPGIDAASAWRWREMLGQERLDGATAALHARLLEQAQR